MTACFGLLALGCGGEDKDTDEAGSVDDGQDTASVDSGDEPDPDPEDSGNPDCDLETDYPVTWDGWASGFFATYCRSCHSVTTPNRQGAPEGMDFDTQADVDHHFDRIWLTVLEQERMPVGGGVYSDDLLLVTEYLCSRLD